MSLFEILVVLIVGFLVMKPEDLPKIIKKYSDLQGFITNSKKEIMSYIAPISEGRDSILQEFSDNLDEEMEQMNFYLTKITNLGMEYTGDYSLDAIKDYYQEVVKSKLQEDNKINS